MTTMDDLLTVENIARAAASPIPPAATTSSPNSNRTQAPNDHHPTPRPTRRLGRLHHPKTTDFAQMTDDLIRRHPSPSADRYPATDPGFADPKPAPST